MHDGCLVTSDGSAAWHPLDPEYYRGPVVRVVLGTPPEPHHRPRKIEGMALIDTGATHSMLDFQRVATPLGLRAVDHETMRFAGPRGPRDVPVYEAALAFPDFDLPSRIHRISGIDLPGPFIALIGMDLLNNTRFSLHWSDDGCFLHWTSIT